jgi:hypothetical protein
LSTNEWSRTAPDGALEALYMAALCVCEGLFLAQPLLRVKESCTAAAGFANSAAHLSSGRLAGLGTRGWRGSLSAEGVKSSRLTTAKRCSSGTGRPVFIDNGLEAYASI